MIPCSTVKVNRRFGGICCLHTQDRKTSQARKHNQEGSKKMEPMLFRNVCWLSPLFHRSAFIWTYLASADMCINFDASYCWKQFYTGEMQLPPPSATSGTSSFHVLGNRSTIPFVRRAPGITSNCCKRWYLRLFRFHCLVTFLCNLLICVDLRLHNMFRNLASFLILYAKQINWAVQKYLR
jgi:hypothetical protein